MPGPRNSKAKQKDAMKKGRARATSRRVSQVVVEDPPRPDLESESSPGSDSSGGPPSDPELSRSFEPDPTIVSPSASASPVDLAQFQSPSKISEDFLPAQPCIHDPGNGPRVRDLFDFLKSRFATPPSWDVPDCMEYHYQHVLDFLSELLPYETALILWYNKTRENARICPVCQRFYRIGDRLYVHPMEPVLDHKTETLLANEQDLSGLCSYVCFGVAGYNYPGIVRAWGKLDHELDDHTREMLNGPGLGVEDSGLGMFVKLSRQDDPGFADLIALCHEEEALEQHEP